jgi:hypothetical protein
MNFGDLPYKGENLILNIIFSLANKSRRILIGAERSECGKWPMSKLAPWPKTDYGGGGIFVIILTVGKGQRGNSPLQKKKKKKEENWPQSNALSLLSRVLEPSLPSAHWRKCNFSFDIKKRLRRCKCFLMMGVLLAACNGRSWLTNDLPFLGRCFA